MQSCCVPSESLTRPLSHGSTDPHRDSALVLGCVFSESLFVSLPTDRRAHHPANLLLLPICSTIHSITFFSQHSTVTSWSGDEHGFRSSVVASTISRFRSQFPTERQE
jgi:hypothetical protein